MQDIDQACECMKNGKVILYPTDTIWGIGCDATNSTAVRRVYSIKRRDDSKALLLLVPDFETVVRYFGPQSIEVQHLLSDNERPTTVILNGATGIAPELKAADGSVGVRITREEFSNKLCSRFGKPVVSTSANFSGDPSPASFSDISRNLINEVDYVCSSRHDDNTPHRPSRIVKIEPDGKITIIRP